MSPATPPPTDQLPAIPEGWVWSTRTDTSLVATNTALGRSIELHPSPADPGWTVMGLGGYGPSCPIFGDGLSMSEALDRAIAEMEAHQDGESLAVVRQAGTGPGTGGVPSAETAPEDTGKRDDPDRTHHRLSEFEE